MMRKTVTTISRKAFEEKQKKAVCRFCQGSHDVMHWTPEPSFPLHRKADGMVCEGSGESLERAEKDHISPIMKMEHIKLNPELGNSKMPNFYEADNSFDLGF